MPAYFEFEVSLQGARPRIWRRFAIRREASFNDLHRAIQDACGWLNCHLFEFRSIEVDIGIARSPHDDEPGRTPDARRVKLADFFAQGRRRILCEYDFGDEWLHLVRLKRTFRHPLGFKRRLLGGARAFPKEDCGGIHGYRDCVRAVRTGRDRDGLLHWLGDWHPEAFDFEAVRKRFDDPEVPTLPDDEFPNDDMVEFLSREAERALRPALDRFPIDIEALTRYRPLAAKLAAAREARSLSLKEAAAALEVPQYRLKEIEDGSPDRIETDLLVRYVDLLQSNDLFERWKAANPKLASRLLRGSHGTDRGKAR